MWKVVVPSDVLPLALPGEVAQVDRLEPHEQAAQPGPYRLFEQAGCEHRVDGTGGLPDPAEAGHPVEQRRGEAPVAEQVVVEEVQVPPGQPVDLGERGVHRLRVEGLPALEERVLIAEVAVVRAAARDHDRVRYQVPVPLDQVPPDRREADQRAVARDVARACLTAPEIIEEHRPGVLAWPEEDRVGVRGGLVRQRGDVQPAEGDEDAAGPVRVGQLVGAAGRRDVDLDHHEVGPVAVEVQPLHVLVPDPHLVVRAQVPGQGRQPQRGKQRVLDRPEERAGRLGQRRQDHRDAHEKEARTRMWSIRVRAVRILVSS